MGKIFGKPRRIRSHMDEHCCLVSVLPGKDVFKDEGKSLLFGATLPQILRQEASVSTLDGQVEIDLHRFQVFELMLWCERTLWYFDNPGQVFSPARVSRRGPDFGPAHAQPRAGFTEFFLLPQDCGLCFEAACEKASLRLVPKEQEHICDQEN